jgi:hypothetical protein
MKAINLKFGNWMPDQPDYHSGGATEAKNVIPFANSYLPLKAVTQITDALTARARGAISVRDSGGQAYLFTGDETKIYSLAGNVHTNVSKSGNYALSEEENWEFIKFGSTVIAINSDTTTQAITLGGSLFADLAGSPPKARHGSIVANFVVLGNIDDGTARQNRVKWSGINSSTSWANSATTQSDYQDLFSNELKGGGDIQAITGGEYGNVFQEYTIWRMTYVGSPLIFQFDEVQAGYGTPCKNSVVQEGRITHFLGQDGFYQLIDGAQIKPIGEGKVNNFFFDEYDSDHPHRVVGASDPKSSIVAWIYPTTGNNGNPNRIIFYDWAHDKWSRGEVDLNWMYTGIGQGYTLEQLDDVSSSIDDLTTSLDAKMWTAKDLQLAVYDTEHKKGTFAGTALSAVIETPEAQLFNDKRAFVDGVRPLIDGASTTMTVQLGTRDLQNSASSFDTAVSPESDTGIAHTRSDARYHKVRVTTTGDFNHAVGVDIFAQESGQR